MRLSGARHGRECALCGLSHLNNPKNHRHSTRETRALRAEQSLGQNYSRECAHLGGADFSFLRAAGKGVFNTWISATAYTSRESVAAGEMAHVALVVIYIPLGMRPTDVNANAVLLRGPFQKWD